MAVDGRRNATPVKVACYSTVMLLILGALIVVFGNYRSGSTSEFHAIFDNSSGLTKGQNVRAAGVAVGKVGAVELQPDASVRVSFTVSDSRPLTTATTATVRYENLTGDRYLEIAPGSDDAALPLSPGQTISEERTAPALDIDSLIGGFRPLFQTVRGEDLNRLTNALIGVLQGQGGDIRTLLTSAGSATTMLADQDAVIGEMVDDLNSVLATVDNRRQQVSDVVLRLQQLVTQFAHQDDPIGRIVGRLEKATLAAGGLTNAIRPDFRATVVQLDRVAGELANGKDALDSTLAGLPGAYRRLARMGAYGASFQFYACQAILRLTGTDGKNLDIPVLDQTGGRCSG